MDNRFDFIVSKLISGDTCFDAVSGAKDDEVKPIELVDLLQFVVHYRDSIKFSGNNRILVSGDDLPSKMNEKLAACGFHLEPLKFAK